MYTYYRVVVESPLDRDQKIRLKVKVFDSIFDVDHFIKSQHDNSTWLPKLNGKKVFNRHIPSLSGIYARYQDDKNGEYWKDINSIHPSVLRHLK